MRLLNILFFMLFSFCALAQDESPYFINVKKKHDILILNHGMASLEERLQMIERAKVSIDIEYFYYHTDKSGKLFNQTLIDAVTKNPKLKVRILLDHLLVNKEFDGFYAYELQKHGIEVKYFNPNSPLISYKGQYRNHRKFLIIDSNEAMTGGRNIGDEYFDLKENLNFLDRDILVKGEIVSSIRKTFDHFWNSPLSIKIKRQGPSLSSIGSIFNMQDNYSEEWDKKVEVAKKFFNVRETNINNQIRALGKKALVLEHRDVCHDMTFASEYPLSGEDTKNLRIVNNVISSQIVNAKESMLVELPYFILNKQSEVPLDIALRGQTKIKLLTNSMNSTDAVYAFDVFNSQIKDWINSGLESNLFIGSLIDNYPVLNNSIAKATFGVHAKTFIYDNKDVTIGSFNFDPRSINLNTEDIITCKGNPRLAQAVAQQIEARLKSSVHIDTLEKADEVKFLNVGTAKKIAYYVLKIPAKMFTELL